MKVFERIAQTYEIGEINLIPATTIDRRRLDMLGKDEFYTVSLNLDVKSLVNLCKTNKSLQKLCNDSVWVAKLQQDYPGYFRIRNISPKDQYRILHKWNNDIVFDKYLITFHGSIEEGNFFRIDYDDETANVDKYKPDMYPNYNDKDGLMYSDDYTKKVPYEYVHLRFPVAFQEVVTMLKSRPLPNFKTGYTQEPSKIAIVSPVNLGGAPFIIIDESTKILDPVINSEWDFIQEIVRYKYRHLSNKELIARKHLGYLLVEQGAPEYQTPIPSTLWDMETVIYDDETRDHLPVWDEFYYEGFEEVDRNDIVPSLDRYGDKYKDVIFLRISN